MPEFINLTVKIGMIQDDELCTEITRDIDNLLAKYRYKQFSHKYGTVDSFGESEVQFFPDTSF